MEYHDGKPTVLVVEDDANLRRLVVHMLANGGFETQSTGTAAEGLSLVRERQGAFDLAILDMMMPGVSGLDLATDLDREYPNLKILYMSGFVGSVAAEVLSRRSPDRVLLKPFTEQKLLERVRTLLGIAPSHEVGRTAAVPDGKPAVPDAKLG
jgi:DNA-binding response OmpR family regulator